MCPRATRVTPMTARLPPPRGARSLGGPGPSARHQRAIAIATRGVPDDAVSRSCERTPWVPRSAGSSSGPRQRMPRNSYLGPRGGPMRAPTDRPSGGTIDALVGTVIASRFFLEARIGRGSMGTVYRARHVRFGRLFAVKVPHPHLLADETVGRRFDREAALAGKLQHRNIVNVVEGGQTEAGMRYVVMDYIAGPTLGGLIERGPLRADHAIRLLQQLCDGLHHAHEVGLVHRDFKPDNVIVERVGHADE